MSVVGVIASFANTSATVIRTALGTRVNGRYQAGASSSFSLTACVQPISGRDLQVIPEGKRADEVRALYATTELRTQQGSNDPDKILIGADTWEVFHLETWLAFGTTHYRALISKITAGASVAQFAVTLAGDSIVATGTVV